MLFSCEKINLEMKATGKGLRPQQAAAAIPDKPAHIFFVWLENHGYNSIIGSSNAPYINSLIKRGTLFTNTYALTHPSQPNYIRFFSGAYNGITNDNCIITPLKTINMFSVLNEKGISMRWVNESLPYMGSTVCEAYPYVKKHNPMASFSQDSSYANKTFTYLKLQDTSTFRKLANVVCISPNMLHDMHDGTILQSDSWLRANFSKLIDWCMINNSIFVAYYDESETASDNRLPVIMLGQHVKQNYLATSHYDHYNWTLTVTSMFGVAKTAWQANPKAWVNISPRTEITGWEK